MTFNQLQQQLIKLKNNYFLIGLKTGTEVEAMNFKEIEVMKKLSHKIMPLTVKIGGPEARNDLCQLLELGIDHILAPMIESPYGLKNFIATVEEIMPKDLAQSTLNCMINIETVYAYRNLYDIVQSVYFKKINQVTVGRSDLSGSMGRPVDDPQVMQAASEIVSIAKLHHKMTSVGGKITTLNCELIRTEIKPHYINSRHMVISTQAKNMVQCVEMALLWERELYYFLKTIFPSRKAFYNERINSLQKRITIPCSHLTSL